MTAQQWLSESTKFLDKAGISSAQLDCLILLEDELGHDRAYILAHTEQDLSPAQIKKLDSQVKRRVQHEPLSYIRGKTEFFGRDFILNADVLEPRPESETMIELLINLVDSRQPTVDSELQIADIGTGSGALAITAKLELPKAAVVATDIDASCLKVAKQNAERLQADIALKEGNLLEPVIDKKLNVILANLPYVPNNWQINNAAHHEPRLAIFGGADGLDLYRKLFKQLQSADWKPDYILTESLPPQHKALNAIAKEAGYYQADEQDFIQVFS